MDQLAKDACAATKAGLTYGKYMARKETLAAATKSATLRAIRKCVLCGHQLPAGKGNRRYCSSECANKYREEQAQKRRK